MATTLTLTISDITVRRFDGEFNRYTPNTERYVYRALVFGRSADGMSVRFYADSIQQAVACVPSAAVVTYRGEGDFLTTPSGEVATATKRGETEPAPKFSQGDVITIRATVKDGKYTRVKLVK
jgi:hypothetical protein